MRFSKVLAVSVISAFCMMSVSPSSYSCSRILDVVKDHDVLVGRSMDWYGEMPTSLYVYPRGMERVGSMDANPIEWTAKYGSVVAASYDMFTTDGFNEQGLGAHLLWLEPSDYGQREVSQPGLYVFLWAQYYLDNFATVDEAINFTNTHAFQILPFFLKEKQRWVKLHLAIEDATGDSAIIEYIDGKPHIYHDRAYTVMTNDPVYNMQLEHLKDYIGFGGDKPLPGSASAEDRFVRASYYLKTLPQPATEHEQMTYLTSIVNNVSHPFESPTPKLPAVTGTIWTTMLDLTHKMYYFKWAGSLGTTWTDLNKFDLRAGAPTMRLDVTSHPDISGDVISQYQAV
jgi:choloylglycine hydrolase